MKHILITTIAAVVLVGCGPSEADRALFKAVERGNIKAVKQQLAAGADVNAKHAKREDGITQLHFAVGKGHKEIVELLIAKGADVNAKSDGDWTPLHYAASNKSHKETVGLLLAKGADVNAKDVEGFTPLDKSALWDHKEIADLLVKHGGKSGAADSIHVAAAVGNIEAVKQHLDAGADVNAKMNNGSTSLHAATTKEVAELLIANGAEVNAKTRTGRTPLHNGDTKGIVELLIAKGANVNALILSGSHQGKTPLDTADNKETADLLRKHGGKTGEEL